MTEEFSKTFDAMLERIHHDHPNKEVITVYGSVANTRTSVAKDRVVLQISDSPQLFTTALAVYHLHPP